MIRLEPATEYDLLWMFDTRNIPEVYQGFYTQDKPLRWDEHLDWWNSRSTTWRSFVVKGSWSISEWVIREEIVGVVTIGQLDHWSPEIGYYISPPRWGRGYGKQAVQQALRFIKKQRKDYCHTTVLKSNERSIRLLKSLGFEYMAEARKGEVWMTKEL